MKKKQLKIVSSLYMYWGSKLFLTMRLTVLVLCLTVFQGLALSTKAQNGRLNLKMGKASIKEVLNSIEEKTDYYFLYNSLLVDVEQKVTIDASDENINQVLSKVFSGTDINFEIQGRQVLLSKQEIGNVQPAKTNVSGKVTDSSGQPLPGVSIVIKGTTIGTITAFDGKYSLPDVPYNAVLQFSFVGMKTQEIAVTGKTTINVVLTENAIGIEEVVAIGYGTMKKSDLTGAISSIKMDDVRDIAVTSIDRILQGNASGVEVINSDGLPGSTPSVKIRGVGTFGDSEPLYVVDGVVFFNSRGYEESNPLSLINPNDIESVEILKDAATAAIYGARGANGVIVITTKKGISGKPKISFNSYYGVAQTWKFYDVLNAAQYVDLAKDIYGESKLKTRIASDYAKVTRTDWQEEVLQPAPWMNYDLSFSGGTNTHKYFISSGYLNQDGTIIGYNYKRLSFRVNTEFNIGEKFLIGENISIAQTNTKHSQTNLRDAIRHAPYMEVYDEENLGGYSNMSQTLDMVGMFNPVGQNSNVDDNSAHFRVIGNVFAEYNVINNLKFKTTLNVDLSTRSRVGFTKKHVDGDILFPTILKESYNLGKSYIWDNTINYQKSITKHSIQLLMGSSVSQGTGRMLEVSGSGFANEELQSLTVASPDQVAVNLSPDVTGPYHDAMLSFFGRISYSFDDKYLLNANFRRDGSSRFGPSNRWGNFPSFSAGWKLHKENFIKDIDFISILKLRASWGKNGNDRIPLYQHMALVHQNNIIYPFGQEPVLEYGATIKDLSSPNLKWEETTSTSVGVDLGLFNQKLELTVDLFNRKTKDILVQTPIPPSVGAGGLRDDFGYPITNAADIMNKGIEISANYKKMEGSFNYSFNGNVTFIKNEVTALASDDSYIQSGITRSMVGYPIGGFYVWTFDKVYSTQAEVVADNANAIAQGQKYYDSKNKGKSLAGDVRYADINGDGTVNDNDRIILGNGMPDFTYSFGVDLWYRNFDLSIQLYGVYGNELYNDGKRKLMATDIISNKPIEVLNRWRKEGDVTNIPRAIEKDPGANYSRESSFWIEDGSYMRLKNLTLGYSVNNQFIGNKNLVSKLRLYVSGQNLLTFTKYTGMDPEVGSSNDGSDNYNLGRGVDTGARIPQPRILLVGIQANF